jgi:membrane-associated phospholipid phosphatase
MPAVGFVVAISLSWSASFCRVAQAADAAAQPKPKTVRPTRLSDWILRNPGGENAYAAGLSWRVAEEVPAQTALRLSLLESLSGTADVRGDPESMRALREWLSTLPVTGRVPVANTDPRWLQVNPGRDPILRPSHSVVLPQRPATVTVLMANGTRCRVRHAAGFEVKSYVEACKRAGVGSADWAYVAQPDGRVQRFSVAMWNEQKQDEPAPGAWIWAPPRGRAWPERFSERLIQFLATQGPAQDVDAGPPVPPENEAAPASPSGEGGLAEGLKLSDVLSSTAPTPRATDLPQSAQTAAPVALRAEEATAKSRDRVVSSSDWGSVGLLQTPTARMRDAGALSFNYSRVQPYVRMNVFAQPFDWLEVGFRYSEITNQLYGPAELSGDQTFKDKSIDFKLRAWKETAYLPEVAIGFRDIGGTGLFAGEYIVANKRTGDFDWSLGMGWGYTGGRGDIRNPLSVLSSRFDVRTGATGQGGDVSFGRYFRGPAALFGGVQYHTPWDRLTVKVEYEGNDYQNEPFANTQRQSSPVNVGLTYRATSGIDLSLGLERGNTLMFSVALFGQLNKLTQPKLADPAPVPVANARPSREPDWSLTARELERQTYWQVRSIEQRDNEVRVVVEDANAAYWRSRVDRIAGVLHRDAPASIEKFTVTQRQRGVDTAEHVIDRGAWVDQRVQRPPPTEQREAIVARAPSQTGAGDVVHSGPRETFTHGASLHYSQILGGPDAFALYQVYAQESASLRLRPDTWVQGAVRARLVDNYDQFRYTGPSNLPRVRTLQREFVTTSRVTVPYLQLSHVGKVGDNHYYSAYGGLLEEMYGGVGAEWLYRPFASRVAVGVDINAVRQREFHQHFAFRDYQVVTGHATLYWDTGWEDVSARISAGRYLAGDLGATVQLARTFKNGLTLGAFATKTNVSAEQFGEGSFDKGLFFSIPFDAMFVRSTGNSVGFTWRPLTRDGGAMLGRNVQLHNLTRLRSDRALEAEAAPLPNESLLPADRREDWSPKPAGLEPYTRVTPRLPAERWERPSSIDAHRLETTLVKQEFRNVKVSYDPTQRVIVTASNDQLRPIGRAVGRAARTALLQAPLEARGVEVTLVEGVTPQARYEFFDLEKLRRFFDGDLALDDLRPYVKVHWLSPAAAVRDPLERLGDADAQPNPSILASLVPDTLSVGRLANDVVGAGVAATKVDWLRIGAAGAALVLASTRLDERAHRYAESKAGSRWVTQGVRIGDALPLAGIGIAGLLALDGSDPRRSRTGYASLEAGATAYAAALGLKYVVGRARPNVGVGYKTFDRSRTSEDAYQSFPSGHAMIAWALATPFAMEYEMPWLYGLAAATNLARIGSREHWLSDTVASSVIGYGLGRLFWQSGRDQAKGEPRVYFDGQSLGMLWDW